MLYLVGSTATGGSLAGSRASSGATVSTCIKLSKHQHGARHCGGSTRYQGMTRTYVVTGAASGIGAATRRYLEQRGGRVIGCDLHDADVIADLTTPAGRSELIAGVTRLSGGDIDAIVANAGGGPPETSLALNFFGAVATLDGLRPLCRGSGAPRAVAVSSIASLRPPHAEIVAACLRRDEPTAIAVAREVIAADAEGR
jgi:NAD(P)-dependent dehydrogenase (short-subunit alcohol dehydrogenase family)